MLNTTRFEFAHRTVDTILEAAKLLRWVTEAQQCALALHATTIELFSGCLALADTERAAAIPIVLRSLFEAVVDLENLLKQREFVKNMEAANLMQTKKLLVQGRVNPLLHGMDKGKDTATNLREFGTRLAELKRQGREALSIEDRCAAVDRGDEYRSVYALLTLDVHNNLAALGDRHYVDTGENGTITFFADNSGKSEMRLSMATGYLLQSAEMVHRAFQTGDTAVSALLLEFDCARKERTRSAAAPGVCPT
jgi:hypothetical protein